MPSKRYYDNEMQLELNALQQKLLRDWLDKSLPKDWDGMDSWERLEKPKTRVTIRLDADMVKWFRKLGPNYSRRINSVLRTYWMALMAGYIQAHDKDNTIVRLSLAARYLAEGKNMDGTEKE